MYIVDANLNIWNRNCNKSGKWFLSFCQFLPLFAGKNRFKPANGINYFLPAEMPTLDFVVRQISLAGEFL